MSIQLIPFRAEHALALYDPAVGWSIQDAADNAVAKEQRGPAWTAMDGNLVLGAAGIGIIWPGRGEAWSAFTVELKAMPVWLTRTVKQRMEAIITEHKLHRVDIYCRATDDKATHWAHLLGFRNPILMEKWGPDGAAYFNMSLVR